LIRISINRGVRLRRDCRENPALKTGFSKGRLGAGIPMGRFNRTRRLLCIIRTITRSPNPGAQYIL
jgi:hypothetical protein